MNALFAENHTGLLGVHPLFDAWFLTACEGTLLGAVVYLASRTLIKKRPRLVSLGWTIVFLVPIVHLVAGPVLVIPLPELGSPAEAIHPIVHERIERPEVRAPDPPTMAAPIAVPSVAHGQVAGGGGAKADEPESPRSFPTIPTIVVAVWGLGALYLLARYGLQRLMLELILRRSRAASPWLRERLKVECETLPSWWTVRLRIASGIDTPGVVGVLFPVIVMPDWLDDIANETLGSFALRHEVMHLRHGDTVADLVRRAACCMYWFYPAVWWAARQWELAAELACDRDAVRDKSDIHRYAESLLHLGECARASGGRGLSVTLNISRGNLAHRIRALVALDLRVPTLGRKSKIFLAAIALLVLCVGVQSTTLASDSISMSRWVNAVQQMANIMPHFPEDSTYSPGPDSSGLAERILEFPPDGIQASLHIDNVTVEARGRIVAPARAIVSLSIDSAQATDLTFLDALPADAVQYLVFSGGVPDEQLKHVGRLTGLQHLDLFESGVSDTGLTHLSGLKNLLHLELNSTFITDDGLSNLLDMQRLYHLDINRTQVTDAGMATLAQIASLSYIDLWKTKVTDAGVAHLSNLPNITYIGLEDNKITDAAVEHFLNWPKLKEVDLEHTQVTDKAVAILQRLPEIHWLDLTDTLVSKASVPQLARLTKLCNLNLPTTISAADCQPLAGLQAYPSIPNRGYLLPVTVRVVDATTGAPLPGVELTCIPNQVMGRHRDGNSTAHVWTGSDGTVTYYTKPSDATSLVYLVLDGYVSQTLILSHDQPDSPIGARVALEPAIHVGGVVLDPGGIPLAGARVSMPVIAGANIDTRATLDYARITDEQGRWECRSAPPGLEDFWVEVSHPDYGHQVSAGLALDLGALRSGTLAISMPEAQPITGYVRTADGTPVPNAYVMVMQPWRGSRDNCTEYRALTGTDGAFSIVRPWPGELMFSVSAAGFFPYNRSIDEELANAPIAITLQESS